MEDAPREHKKFKDEISDMKGRVEKLKERAGKLRNKHLADLLIAGFGRLQMALEHPDVDLLEDDETRDEAERGAHVDGPLQSGGNLHFAAGDPGAAAQAQEADRRAAFAQHGEGSGGAPFPAAV